MQNKTESEKKIRVKLVINALDLFGRNLDRDAIELFMELVEDIPTDLLKDSLARCLKTNSRPPVPAEVINASNEITEERKSEIRSTEEYWARVRKTRSEMARLFDWDYNFQVPRQREFETALEHLGFSPTDVFFEDI
jgi:hypothetical protein